MNELNLQNKQKEILNLAIDLIKIPAISIGKHKNLKAIYQCYEYIVQFLKNANLRVIEFKNGNSFPGLYCDTGDEDILSGKILFLGHYDRVSPQNHRQLIPIVEGDWLKARGATDMLTTVATILVLLKDLKKMNKNVKFGILLVGNEEPGETVQCGTPHILEELAEAFNYKPEFAIIGERTGEGPMKVGKIELKNRGLIRIHLTAKGKQEHSAQIVEPTLIDRIIQLSNYLQKLFYKSKRKHWKTTFSLPYIFAGELANFNTTPNEVEAGLEIRPIPEDNFESIISKLEKKLKELEIEFKYINKEPGKIANLKYSMIQNLLNIIINLYGGNKQKYLGIGKPHATQARFLKIPCVIFGQAGIGPHSENEAHYIPSIIPYYLIFKQFLLEAGK